ncbi:marR family protein, partial [Vibrio harveyi]
MFIATLC